MGLKGPFPATLEIATLEEGEALLELLNVATHLRLDRNCTHDQCDQCDKGRLFERLGNKVLFACGDD